MSWSKEQREKYNVPYADRPAEQRIRATTAQKAKAAAKALAEGRTPGKIGRPPRLTAEEKEASRIAQNKKRTKRTSAKKKAARAARAISQGRVPGVVGSPSKLSKDQRRIALLEKAKRCREKNMATYKAKAALDARAKRAAKRDGTWVSRKKILTPEQRRIVNVVMSANRRARLRNVNAQPVKASDYRMLRWRQNGICPCCNMNLGEHDIHLDHWVPLIKGGSGDRENLRLLHGVCNLKKGAKHPDELGLGIIQLAA